MTLASALNRNLHIFFRALPAVRDGEPNAIHDARVASRRLRAIASFAGASDESKPAKRLLRSAGRLLGRARDVDVADAVLRDLQRRLPSAAHLTSAAASLLGRRREKQRRRLVKGLDELGLEDLRRLGSLVKRPDRATIEAVVGLRAGKLRAAVVAASGVYMPNRTHKVRIETKKLRYALEPLSRETLFADIRQLKRVQQILGELRDKQALLELLKQLDAADAERGAVLTLLEQECLALFGRYLPHRPEMLAICDEARWARRDWRATIAPIAALATVVAPPAIGWLATCRSGAVSPARPIARKEPASVAEDLMLVEK